MACIIKAKRACTEWRIRNCSSVDDFCAGQSFGPATTHKIVQWEPPPSGSVKLNFDGSVQHTSATGAYFNRDWEGTVLKAGSHHYGCASVLLTEARALRDGVQAANMVGFHNIIIEGDNQIIINALLGVISSPWKISTVINDVRFLLQYNNRTSFKCGISSERQTWLPIGYPNMVIFIKLWWRTLELSIGNYRKLSGRTGRGDLFWEKAPSLYLYHLPC